MPEMQQSEFQELRDHVHGIGLHDIHLGRCLNLIIHHLGHLYGYDMYEEDAKAREAKRQETRDTEDAKVEEDINMRKQERAEEDGMTSTPAQKEALAQKRTEEDKQAKVDAKARNEKRSQEDKQLAQSNTQEDKNAI